MKKVSKCMAVLATLSLVFSLFFACKQSSDDEVVLSEISVTLKDESKVFKTGDELKVEDVLVKAMYSDESERDVTKEAAFDPKLPYTIKNSMQLNVSYRGKTASLPIAIEANEIERISIKRADSTKTFFVGDEISEKDFVVTAKYKDGTLKVLSEGVVFSGLGELQKGTVKITATYNDFEAYCEVIVISEDDLNDVENLKGITLALKEGKTFVEGGEISKADFTVTATYSNDTKNDVTEKALFTGFIDSLPAGFVTITAQYGLATCSLVISVAKKNSEYDEIKGEDGSVIKLTGISLALKESKTFVEGDKVSKDDLVVTAKYSNESSKTVTDGVEFDGIDEELVAGQAVIWAIYGSKHASLDISVSAKPGEAILEEISITLKEIKTFVEGDTISASDFVVTAKYSDGTSKTVTETDGVKFTNGLGEAKAGNIAVVVTYLTKTTFKTITVVEKPVDDPETPNALYIVGDFAESSWMTFVPMQKEGNCFYYEFQRGGLVEFKICRTQDWNEQAFAGVTIPSTGFYIASLPEELLYSGGNADVDIVSPGDRVYLRYKNGICYVRYAKKDERVDPNEEMKVVFNISVVNLPRYAIVGDVLTAEVLKDSFNPATYEYQWYRYLFSESQKDAIAISGATSETSPKCEEGYYYYCVVTAVLQENPENKIIKQTSACYIDTDAEITVTFPSDTVTLTDEAGLAVLRVDVSTSFYDYIKWNLSNLQVVKVFTNSYSYSNNITIYAVGTGNSNVTATVVRNDEEVASATCEVVVKSVKALEEWWYYELDTSKVSSLDVNLIFNMCIDAESGGAQTSNIENIPSTGEIAFQWDGNYCQKYFVDNSIRQEGLDTGNKLVVYVYIPEGCPLVNLYSWVDVSNPLDPAINLTGGWPGVPMKSCSQAGEALSPTEPSPAE